MKTNKSAVLMAKVQDMTDRYDIANLQKHIFFLIERIFRAHFMLFFFLYHSFRNVNRFFFRSIQSSANTFSSKRRKKMENLGTDPSTPRMLSGRSTI